MMANKSRRSRKRKTRLIARSEKGLTARSSPANAAADVREVLEAVIRLAAFPLQLEAKRELVNATLLVSTAKQIASAAGPDVLVARQKLLEDTAAGIDSQLAAVALFGERLGRLGEALIAEHPEDARSFLKTRSEQLETQLADLSNDAEKEVIKAQIARAKSLLKLPLSETKTRKRTGGNKTKRSSKVKA